MIVKELVEFLNKQSQDVEVLLEAVSDRRDVKAARLTLVYDSRVKVSDEDRRFYDVLPDKFGPGVDCIVLSGWNGGTEQEEMLKRNKTDDSIHFNPF